MKKRVFVFILFLILFVLGSILIYVRFDSKPKDKKKNKEIYFKLNLKYPRFEKSSVSLIMVGDCLIHGSIYDDAKENGRYNFYKMVDLVKPKIKEYDLAFYNQESILGGTALGLSSYPTFNSPQEVGDAFIDMGFNLVSLANNHTLDRGKKAIQSSLAYWKSKEGIMTAGSYESEEDRTTPRIMEKNGIKYALLSYTTTTNGIPVPKDASYLVDVYEKNKVKEDIERLKGKADLIMVAMHWGEEYTHVPNSSQKEIAQYLTSLGVNIVIGHHPHVIQPVEFIGDTMVIYSLGNFISSQYGTEKLTGLEMSVNIEKIVFNDLVSLSLKNPKASLVYTYSVKNRYRHSYRLYPYEMLNDNILKGYKSYYEKYMNIVLSMGANIEKD